MKLQIAMMALLATALSLCHATEAPADDDGSLRLYMHNVIAGQKAEPTRVEEPNFLRFAVRDADTQKPIPGANIQGHALVPVEFTRGIEREAEGMLMLINTTTESSGDISLGVGKIASVVGLCADVTADGYEKGSVKMRSFDFKQPITVFLKKQQ